VGRASPPGGISRLPSISGSSCRSRLTSRGRQPVFVESWRWRWFSARVSRVAGRRSQTASGRHVRCRSPSWCGCPPQAADQCQALPSRSLVPRPVRASAMLMQSRPHASCLARPADTIYSSLRRGLRRRR
jgi:hypothetical protein